MKMSKLKISTKNQAYNVIVGNNLIKNLLKILKYNSIGFNKCLLVIDKKVPKKFSKIILSSLKRKKNLLTTLIQKKLTKAKKL